LAASLSRVESPCYHSHLRFGGFLMLQLPPQLTLFPYTTLFRSNKSLVSLAAAAAFLIVATPGPKVQAAAATTVPMIKADASEIIDRKSTRLNSSHVKSSYAVFCLKKKTHVTRSRTRPTLRDAAM